MKWQSNMNKITYGRQTIRQDDIDEVIKALKSPAITQGEYVPAFEDALKEYTGVKYAVAVSSGTAALHTVYAALGLKENDEIITCPNTFAATSNAALYLNAKPKFADINADDFLIDENKINPLITKNTKIITPIHYAGLTCNMEELSKTAKNHNIKIVEDACHALGSYYKNSKTGSCEYSDAAVFSFHPVKHITTAEGGAVLTNDEEVYKKCLLYRSHGMEKVNFKNTPDSPAYHEMQLLGYNYRMTDIQAALGISQLKKIESFVKRRLEIADIYYDAFKNSSKIKLQKKYSDRLNSHHLFSVVFESNDLRDKVFYYLKENNIFTQIHYMPVNKHPYYEALGYNYKDTPLAYDFYRCELSLPVYPLLTNEEVYFVIDKINTVLKVL